MVDETILSFTLLKCSLNNWCKPAEEVVLFRSCGCPWSFGLCILCCHGTCFAQTCLALLQTPDSISTFILCQHSFSLVAVCVGQVELGLHLKVSTPMTKNLLIEGVKVVSSCGEHFAGLVCKSRNKGGVVLQLNCPGNGHLLCLCSALVDVSCCDPAIQIPPIGTLLQQLWQQGILDKFHHACRLLQAGVHLLRLLHADLLLGSEHGRVLHEPEASVHEYAPHLKHRVRL